MSRAVKNIYFPFSVRSKYKSDKELIGYFPINSLGDFKTRPKQEQLLFSYNFKSAPRRKSTVNASGKVSNFVTFFKTQQRCEQITFVIDFDVKDPEIAEIIDRQFEEFEKATECRCLLARSPSGGRHILYVLEADGKVVTEQVYAYMQNLVIQKFFSKSLSVVDFPSSCSMRRSFYHSQHLENWINMGIVNLTKASQGSSGLFWEKALSLDIVQWWALFGGAKWETLDQLKFQYMYTHYALIQGVTGYGADQQEAWPKERLEQVTEEYIRLLDGILQGGEGCGQLFEIARNAAQGEQFKASYSDVKSILGSESSSVGRLSEVLDALAEGRYYGRGDLKDPEPAARSTQDDGLISLSTGSSASDTAGCGDSSGDEGDFSGGLPGYFSTSSILGVVQNVQLLCDARGFQLEELGHKLSTYNLRSHIYWEFSSEESDLALFSGVVRQVLETDPRYTRDFGTSPTGPYKWFRYAAAYLKSQPGYSVSLLKSTQVCANSLRLYCRSQHIQCSLIMPRSERDGVAIFKAEEFLAHCFPEGDCSKRCPGINKQNVQSLNRMYKEEFEELAEGCHHFFNHLRALFPKLSVGEYIAIGLEDFQRFFETHVRKAGALRVLFMSVLAEKMNEYVACAKRRSFVINMKVLSKFVETKGFNKLPTDAESLAKRLGNGRTWESICAFSAALYDRFGMVQAMQIWAEALEMNREVRDVAQRYRDVKAFLEVIHENKLSRA